MSTHPPTITPGPIHWPDGIQCKFGQLRDVIEHAKRAGFFPCRLSIVAGGYKLDFERRPVPAKPTNLPCN
jgi:hypothetical protein